jgi:ribosomal protein S12 methylthiotransferase
LREAQDLLATGVRELNLISQDSTYYGRDLHRRAHGQLELRSGRAETTSLSTLVRELNALPGDFWIRLLYTHPAHWTDELIETIAGCPKVARYVDLPLQHIHDNMLERMRRETSRADIVHLIRRLRSGIPGIALRTTFIVGFPGETEAYFETLLDFIRETRFERLGVFAYSPENGTRAAKMTGQVSARVKRRRLDQAMCLQRHIAEEVGKAWVGRSLKVLLESPLKPSDPSPEGTSAEHGSVRFEKRGVTRQWRRCSVARTEYDAPEIDGRVFVRGHLRTGQFVRVRVLGHTDYDLMAEKEKTE